MSYPTFTDDMVDIVYELDDREIYNDIRSQISGSVTTPGTEPVYAHSYVEPTVFDYPTETSATAYALRNRNVISWDNCFAEFYGWTAFITSSTTGTNASVTVGFTSSSTGMCVARVDYTYLIAPGIPSETEAYTLMVTATNMASINKYGRRTMNLTWPLGQTQAQMQALVNSYCTRYCEPVSRVTMTAVGKTDALIVQMLTLKISDRITVQNTVLDLSQDYFINTIQYEHDVQALPTATYTLEEVRDQEAKHIFILDSSALNGPDILGW